MDVRKKTVLVFGHRNPDTDAIVSSLGYARLKTLAGCDNYISCRCGHLNAQTSFILKTFNVMPPKYISSLEPRVEYFMNNLYTTVNEKQSVWHAITALDLPNLRAIPVVDDAGHYKALLHYSVIAQNFVDILNGEGAGGKYIANRANEEVVKGNCNSKENCNEGEMEDPIGHTHFAMQKNDNNNYTDKSNGIISKELLSNINVIDMADPTIPAVHIEDSLGKVRTLLQTSPIRRLPVIDNDGVVIALISEHDLVRDANIDIVLVDHNEEMQAVPGVENYNILAVIDHHKISPMSTTTPITFINRPIGSTSTIVATLYKEENIQIPTDIAGILLCGIISDTLKLQSATTTDIDKKIAVELANIARLDIETLGNQVLEAGSHIKDKDAATLITQDCKEYKERGLGYTISQIEVGNLGEVLDRKVELMAALNNNRNATKLIFCALLVTDITQLSSILLISCDEKFTPYIKFPKLEDDVYWLKNVVSRKKQLIPLVTEMIVGYSR